MKYHAPLHIFLGIVSTLAAASAIPVTAQAFLTDGLLAYYPFTGNANDASGNGYNGAVNQATLTQDRFGVAGMAYAFNGSDSSISFTIPTLPVGAAARTVSLWAEAQPNPSHGANLFFYGSNQLNDGFGLLNNGSPLTWDAQAWGNDVSSGVGVDAQWHHLAVVYSGTALSIFIDGVQKATGDRALNTPFSAFTLGADLEAGGSATPFQGVIDDVSIYDRALSPTEISQLASAAPVPEPSAYAVISGLALLGFAGWVRRSR